MRSLVRVGLLLLLPCEAMAQEARPTPAALASPRAANAPVDIQELTLGDLWSNANRLKLSTVGTLLAVLTAVLGASFGCGRWWEKHYGAPSVDAKAPLAASTTPDPSRSAAPLAPPQRPGTGILIDLSHKQGGWNYDAARAPSLIELEKLSARLAPPAQPFQFAEVNRDEQLQFDLLKPWSGLVLALPRHSRLGSAAVQSIVRWVRDGGRLALMGYELGDHHHQSNLNELAVHFGLRFESDIVAPAGWTGPEKPYGKPVALSAARGGHPLLDGVAELVLENVQSIRGEPGMIPILAMDGEKVGVLGNPADQVVYNEGTWSVPATSSLRFEFLSPFPGSAVIAEAPRGLTGEGRVLALGTWRLSDPAKAPRFVENFLGWLVGRIA